MKKPSLLSTLEAAVVALEAHELSQGHMAFIREEKVNDEGEVIKVKLTEVYPWTEDDDARAKITHLSALGVLAFAGRSPPGTGVVQDATSSLETILRARGVTYSLAVWGDEPGRTKDDVIALCREAIRSVS